MSTFYVLPPRPVIGERFAAYLAAVFPGRNFGRRSWSELAEALAAAIADHDDVYVVYHEDLPSGESATDALRDGFGAEPGDEVIEVRAGPRQGELTTQRWLLN
ncbi:MAG: hypothetical protein K2R98_00630 [Gemmataceae bacterium]|nr:hypothetical protein [Gemmataceae bacterium]